ncbi:16S rRNA (uracil(1498)-N(3))-methyltransferase [Anaeromyxobacter paludicola]|uniref:Ribosomal RNA small subunit methyltransferase E n=1 Tax=Anaeromyxobacter paludicola TaxID=2918171 RepID=A0ABN6NCC4_9BACT|nr:16S rRNA (uracil(1498)-N(3))-methyltransferase [Anaeromyxobacter paludicola]BDG09963.1 ribosomal RNA small subunit methyltransferase E [Anaeromyxobacter paludicola]
MNLLLLEDGELDDAGVARLDGRRARHAGEVLRAAAGDTLAVGVVGGRMGRATVLESSPDLLVLRAALDAPPPPPSPVSLLLALPRPKILRKVLQSAASMGVKRIALLGTYRVEKSYFASPLLAPAAIREQLLLGLEQGKDTALPEVALFRHFKPFVEDELDRRFGGAARLVAHPGASPTLDGLPAPAAREVLLAIGPEGGFTPYEAETLAARGFAPFSLGARVLRVDAAVPFAVGQVELWARGGRT